METDAAMANLRRRAVCAIVAATAWAALGPGQAAASSGMAAMAATAATAAEAEVKAAVVFNLLALVQWPPEAQGADRRLRLCTFEASPLEGALGQLQGQAVQGMILDVARVEGAGELRACHAVMVEAGNRAALGRAAAAARGQPLLVIGEGGNAVARGAMIGIAVVGGRLAFDVDLGAVRRAQLTVSSKLLRLARSLVE